MKIMSIGIRAHLSCYGIEERTQRSTSRLDYLTLRPFVALASPLPLVPRRPPRPAPPLPADAALPLLEPPPRSAGAGVENFLGVAFED